MSELIAVVLERSVASASVGLPTATVVAAAATTILVRLNWRASPLAIPAIAITPLAVFVDIGIWALAGFAVAAGLRERWLHDDLRKGQDMARRARQAVGLVAIARNRRARRRMAAGSFSGVGHPIGVDEAGAVVCLPCGRDQGRHILAIGATGSGKSTTLLTAATSHVRSGSGLLVLDPKADPDLATNLRAVAQDHHRTFKQFSLTGESVRWNPLGRGTPSELADKLIAAEEWTEPHYKRLYQRYLQAVFLALAARDQTPDLATITDLLRPDRLALFAREIPAGPQADRIDSYLDQLSDRDRQDLSGLRNRLSILVESEAGDLLCAAGSEDDTVDLVSDLDQRAIILYTLNSARYPETAALLAAALIQDLKHAAGILESRVARPATAIILDEFSALNGDHVLGLFQRARSAGLSLMLATQELADLQRVAPGFQDQILGNVEAIVAHRQNVPASAELVAQLAGTQTTWLQTFQTDQAAAARPTRGSMHRGHEFRVAPDTVKQLAVGQAVVITKNPHAVHLTRVTPPRMRA